MSACLKFIIAIAIIFHSYFCMCLQSTIIFPDEKEQIANGKYSKTYGEQKLDRKKLNHNFIHSIVHSTPDSNLQIKKDLMNEQEYGFNNIQSKRQHIIQNKFNIRRTKEKSITNSDSTLGTNVIEALQDISRNDDLQCVAKLLCDFISQQKSKSEFSFFLLPSLLKNIIYYLPATSSNLLYSKAILIGLSDNFNQCYTEYPECPANQNDLLYYLNNHKGGLLKFFNGESNTNVKTNDEESNEPNIYIKKDTNNFKYIISSVLEGLFQETDTFRVTERIPNEHNLKLMENPIKLQNNNLNFQNNYNRATKISEPYTRSGKIVNKIKNNYDATRINWKPVRASEYNNKPLLNNQLTTANPNIYVTNANGDIEYYINRLGQKIYVY